MGIDVPYERDEKSEDKPAGQENTYIVWAEMGLSPELASVFGDGKG